MRTFKCRGIARLTARRPDRLSIVEPGELEQAPEASAAARAFAEREALRVYGSAGMATHLQGVGEPNAFTVFIGEYQGRALTRGETVILTVEEVQ